MVTQSGDTRIFMVNPWLRRLSRASAWALLVGVVVQVVSGWGITQTGIIYDVTFGLIDRRIANTIHRWINLPLASGMNDCFGYQMSSQRRIRIMPANPI